MSTPFQFKFTPFSSYPTNVALELRGIGEGDANAKVYREQIPVGNELTSRQSVVVSDVAEVVFCGRFKNSEFHAPLTCIARHGYHLAAVHAVMVGQLMLRNVVRKVHQVQPGVVPVVQGDIDKEQISFEHFDYEDETRDGEGKPTVAKVHIALYENSTPRGSKVVDVDPDTGKGEKDILLKDIDEIRLQPKKANGDPVGTEYVWHAGLGMFFTYVAAKTDAGEVHSVTQFIEESPMGLGF